MKWLELVAAERCYLGSRSGSPEGGATVLLGVPYDGGVSYRDGARFGPGALREASESLETYSPEQDADLDDLQLIDLGDLVLGEDGLASTEVMHRIESVARGLFSRDCRVLTIGGDHAITPPLVRAAYERHPDLVLVHVDAHADLRVSYEGSAHSHACALRPCVDLLGDASVRQVGIRSGTKEEFRELRECGRWVAPSGVALREAMDLWRGRPVYLTVDLDAFDPAYLPGTGTPEPGGIDWPTFASYVEVLSTHRVVAVDVVELAPSLDPTGASSVWAAKVVRELLLVMAGAVG